MNNKLTRKDIEEMLKYPQYNVTQVPMSIFDQRLIASGMTDRLKQRDFTVFVRSVFLQGLFFLDPDKITDPILLEHAAPKIRMLKQIAEAEDISQKYLESIMTTLSKAGMVDAVHGKGGGYRLNRNPEDYTVGSILKLTEGSLAPVSCTAQGAAACSRTTCCQTKPMWDKLDRMIDDFFEGITLADLLEAE